MGEQYKKWIIINLVSLFFLVSLLSLVSANNYTSELSLISAETVYGLGERIEVKGTLYLSNYSSGTLISNHTVVVNASLNLSIINKTDNVKINSFILNTTSDGSFRSRSDYYPSEVLVSAPSSPGTYYLRLNYTDPNNETWWAQNEIFVSSAAVDLLEVRTDKVSYKQSETLTILAEAIRELAGKRVYLANVTINGSIQNSSKSGIENFSCMTATTGKCSVSTTAPSSLGLYYVEVNTFKAFTTIKVEAFKASVLMKDKLGKSIRNVFSEGEDASVEVTLPSYTSSNTYTFVGVVKNTAGSIVENISSTSLIQNNSFTNRYTWTLDGIGFPKGKYTVVVNVTDSSSNLVQVKTSFEVRSWSLAVKKAETNSNFIYEYSAFPNTTVNLQIYPTYRVNGSVISTINTSTAVNISILDTFSNIHAKANASWNVSCSNNGCYEFTIRVPNRTGDYSLLTKVTFDTDDQSQTKVIHVINKTLTAQSTNSDSLLKDLFSTNEYIYITLSARNETSAINLTNATILRLTYSNGTELSYTEVGNLSSVNLSNNISEWAWGVNSQRLKVDPPRTGGLYSVSIEGDNNTATTITQFTINPYDICAVTKDTAGSVGSGNYYSYQFKTSDTIYFELRMFQADNPAGRASFGNTTNSTSYGLSTACKDFSQTKQVVSNATISIEEVKNLNTGKIFTINTTGSACQADGTNGAYTCTVAPNGTWDAGPYGVKFKVIGQDGTTSDIEYGSFEARSFYINAYSSTWSNKPSANISLTIDMYEAGSNWWGSVGSAGLKGTITLEKIEYMGRQGEWLWPPIDYDYNTTRINSTSITSGRGTMSLLYNATKNNAWATGSYRAVLKGVDDEGNTDYGYGYFEVKQWETYGSPVDCSGTICTSLYNINSKENVTLYITIMNAGEWGTSGTSIGTNVSIKVKKISDCRKWPCTDLNTSSYTSNSITVNQSNGWYWASTNLNKNYTISLNTTSGSWGTGYWQVVLDVNGTETGTAWFNTVAFYTEAKPTDSTGANYKSSIKSNEAKYFDVKTLRSQKSGGYYYISYNLTDYINTTIEDLTLSIWDQGTYNARQLNYPEDINVSIVNGGTVINGSKIVNITYINGSNWQSGYYNGQLTLKDSLNQTANAWLWFQVQPFRVSISMNSTNVDTEGCIAGTIDIYEPSWYSNVLQNGTYNISSVKEDSWSGSSYSTTTYTNFTPSANFVNRTGISLCPNSGSWGSGSWGNYHYLKVSVQDASGNKEQGWVNFRTLPFTVNWGSIVGGSNVLKNSPITVPVNLSKASDGSAATGNVSLVYQWSWDSYQSSKKEYVFNVGQCWSNVSSSCNITGIKNMTIYPPASGWKEGYNYIQGNWKSSTGTAVDEYSSLYFSVKDVYNGYWSNYNASGQWQYNFAPNDNVSLRLYVRDQNQNSIVVNVTKVEYALSSNCWSEYCKSYTTANYLVGSGSNTNVSDSAAITIIKGSSNWSKGTMTVRATVQAANGSSGSSVISGGYAYIKDLSPPTVNLTAPVTSQNITSSALAVNWTTVEDAKCYINLFNFQNFRAWYCLQSSYYPINSSADYCSTSLFNGTSYYSEYISTDYRSYGNGSSWSWGSQSTGLSTGGTTHNYQFNVSKLKAQDYGIQVYCYDEDWNAAYGWATVKVNASG